MPVGEVRIRFGPRVVTVHGCRYSLSIWAINEPETVAISVLRGEDTANIRVVTPFLFCVSRFL